MPETGTVNFISLRSNVLLYLLFVVRSRLLKRIRSEIWQIEVGALLRTMRTERGASQVLNTHLVHLLL